VFVAGTAEHQEKLTQEKRDEPAGDAKPSSGRRVVEIKQPPRRGRGGSGRTHSSGGWSDKRDGQPEAPTEAPAGGDAKPDAKPDAKLDAKLDAKPEGEPTAQT